MCWLTFSTIGLCLGEAYGLDFVAVPKLSGQIVDQTGLLDTHEKIQLINRMAALEKEKGSQIALLILPSTKPETIEQYSMRVADAWEIGRKKIDDGVLMIIALDDRKIRIETGYGLEGAIPDAKANQIIENIMRPAFRAKNFFHGIDQGMLSIERLIRGEPLPEPSAPSNPMGTTDWMSLLFFLSVFLLPLLMAPRFFRAIGMFVIANAITSSMPIAIGAGLLGLAIKSIKSSGRWTRGSSRGSSYGGGGFSGGWSSGGGGFSGGGGSFGGGGASGGW